MMPRNLIFVRHGLSEANVIQTLDKNGDNSWFEENNVTYPDSSWRLTPVGVEQAKTSGDFIKERYSPSTADELNRFIVSPFARTRETASYLGLPNARWEENRDVGERSWGEIGCISHKVFEELYSTNASFKKADPLYWTPPAGESIHQVASNRVRNLLSTLHRESAEDNVIVVSHGEFMWATRLVLERWSNEEFVEFDKDPAHKIHNATVIEYTRIDPITGDEADKLRWVRFSYPMEQEDDSFSMKVGEWREFGRVYLSNEELLAKAELQARRLDS